MNLNCGIIGSAMAIIYHKLRGKKCIFPLLCETCSYMNRSWFYIIYPFNSHQATKYIYLYWHYYLFIYSIRKRKLKKIWEVILCDYICRETHNTHTHTFLKRDKTCSYALLYVRCWLWLKRSFIKNDLRIFVLTIFFLNVGNNSGDGITLLLSKRVIFRCIYFMYTRHIKCPVADIVNKDDYKFPLFEH